MVDVTKLSERKLRELYEKLSAESSAICTRLIAAGFGLERGSETRRRALETGDTLAVEYVDINDRLYAAAEEQAARRRYHGSLKPIKRKE